MDVGIEKTNGAVIYVFNTTDNVVKMQSGLKTRIWQLLPSVCASLLCIPYGLMLGWPSPTYPRLLEVTSPILISLDQSAMIAGFLMIGNILGTPFSSKTLFGSKYGIISSLLLMICGWAVMWQARDIFWLLGSRILTGFGHGFGVGQLKSYIKEMCEESLAGLLLKQINLYTFFGVIVMFSFGPFVNFRLISIISLSVTVFIFLIALLLPPTPKQLVKAKKIKDAKKVLAFIKPQKDSQYEVNVIVENMNSVVDEYGFKRIVKDKTLRKNFAKFAFLVFCQQFSGAPATMIYTQILFDELNSPMPVYFAILYSIVFFSASVLGIFVLPRYNKRKVLLLSSSFVAIAIGLIISVIYFKLSFICWKYSAVPVMLIFIIVHTVGVGNIPFTFIQDFFPPNCQTFTTHFFVMFHSLLALFITKIFQVLMQYNIALPFFLFLFVSLVLFIFVTHFIEKKT